MHLRMPTMQLRRLLANILMDILGRVNSGQHQIPPKTLFNL
jgi:hypothetical protein